MKKVIITSGYFNPLHIGHVNLIREAKKLGDFLVVIVNNDAQVKIKGSVPFMPEQERVEIVKALRYDDDVILAIDKDKTVAETLVLIAKKYPNAELFFAKGGDRNSGNIPENETKACKDYNITIINGVGGDKVQSSSWLLKSAIKSKTFISKKESLSAGIKRFFKIIYRAVFPGIVSFLRVNLSDCKSVLDLGCGFNSPIQYCRVPYKVGIDNFDPYLEQSKAKSIHDKYIKGDVTKIEVETKSFDAVVAIEILEHLSKEEGFKLLKKMEGIARKKIIITTPNGYTYQDAYDNNPLQAHESGWTVDDLERKGFKVFGMDGPKSMRGYKGEIKCKPTFLWLIVSEIAQKVIYYFPNKAFHLFAIKKI